MYIQSNGVLMKKANKLFFKNENNDFLLEGGDATFFYKIYPYLTGTLSLTEILDFLNDPKKKETTETFEIMQKNKIINIKNKPFLSIGVVSESLNQQELIKQFDSLVLKRLVKYVDLGEIDKSDVDMVLVVEKDDNIQYFSKVNECLSKESIPWIKYSYDNNNLYLGPLFFYDGGPCYQCFITRKNRNINEELEIWELSTGNSVNLLGAFIEKELLKLANPKSPSLCFNTEINFDVFNLEIMKYAVYKLPDCKACGAEYND